MPWVWRMDGFQMRPSQHPANGMRPLDHSMRGACDLQTSLVMCVLLHNAAILFGETSTFIKEKCEFHSINVSISWSENT